MAYATLDELKVELGIDPADSRRDGQLKDLLDTATADVDAHCRRSFGQVGTEQDPVARVYDTVGGLLLIDDLVSLDTLEYESGESWVAIDSSTVTLLPRNADTDGRPFTMLRTRSGAALPPVVRITGVWGWPAVPAVVPRATVLQALRLAESGKVPLGVTGGDSMMGSLRIYGDLHPDAAHLLGPLVRMDGIA